MAEPFTHWRRRPRSLRSEGAAPALAFALLAPMIVWSLALLTSYATASHACYPSHAPLARVLGGWGSLQSILAIVNAACFVVLLAGLALALIAWRRMSRRSAAAQGPGQPERPPEEVGRSIALAALIGAGVLGVAIAVNGVSLWLATSCSLA